MRDLNRLILYLAYTLELLVLFMLQETPGLLPAIYGARPVLVLPAGLMMAMMLEETPAMAFGIAAGLFCDFGFSGVLGPHAMIMGTLCFFVSLMVKTFMQANLVTALLTGIVCLALLMGAQWFFFYYMPRYSEPGYAITGHYLPKYIYTLIFIPVLYLLNRGLRDAMRPSEA